MTKAEAAGAELLYTVVYSKRRTLAITVERDRSVIVRAPEGADPAAIRAAVETRRFWLHQKTRHPQKYDGERINPPPGKELVNGEALLYLGREYRIELVDEAGEIELDDGVRVPRALAAERGAAFRRWYKARAQAVILPRVAMWARTMGVTYAAAKISESKYRWGSCTPGGNVLINWRIVKAPMFVVDYVIVHELAHLRVLNHTAEFWNVVEAQITGVKKAKGWLRENGGLLEVDI